MAEQLHASITLESVQYIINHVFLPPQLPQEDDFDGDYESLLLTMVCQTLSAFEKKVQQEYRGAVRIAHESMTRLSRILDSDIALNEELLQTALTELTSTGGSLPLYIKAQNAGLILTAEEDGIVFETFELTPINKWVIETKGRLRREFPASSIRLPLDKFQEHGFIASFAQTISNMSTQTPVESYQVSCKAGRSHPEVRDTVHPRMITHYLTAVLDALGHRTAMVGIWKNTREDTLWSNCFQPWHRSPFWLMVRVALHLHFHRAASNKDQPLDLYKSFMVFFHSNVLKQALRFELSSSLYHVMTAKISQRLLKLAIELDSVWATEIKEILMQAHSVVASRWNSILDISQPDIDLSGLSMLEPSKETHVELPKLDMFIKEIALQKSDRASSVFNCDPFLDDIQEGQPSLEFKNVTKAYQTHALAVFEHWVEKHLEDWKTNNKARLSNGKLINDMIRDYHKSAASHYANNPESHSIMVLTILELWVASDSLTLEEYPMLRQYDSEIAPEILQCLILPTASQMKRLQVVEQYLNQRRINCTPKLPSVFRDFGRKKSFASRYFEQSQKHQDLLVTIENTAERERREKVEELQQKTSSYRNLMRRYDEASCDYVRVLADRDLEIYEKRHSSNCQRCRYLQEASSLKISIHEWPLSRDHDVARATVFELDVPALFREWRNITIYLLFDVLMFEYAETCPPKSKHLYELQTDPSLRFHFVSYRTNVDRINISSAIKSNSGSHYATKFLRFELKEDSICLDNGLSYHYFDTSRASFTVRFRESERLLESCRYVLPNRSTKLQRFLARSHVCSEGPAPNEVIASQCDCPDHMSLDEFRAFASLPLGYLVQWHNILLQLAMPSIDFAKQETSIMLSQVAYQVGPLLSNDFRRDTHKILAEHKMATSVLEKLYENLARVRENWQCKWALQNYVQLARRCLSLLPSDRLEQKYIDFLGCARETAYQWFRILHTRRQDSVDSTYRMEILAHQVEVALVCADTLNIDDHHLKNVFRSPEAISRYVHCSIIIQENSMVFAECSTFTSILHQRWQRFAVTAFETIKHVVIDEQHPGLDEAIGHYWSAYQRTEPWRQCKPPYSHWLETTLLIKGSSVKMIVCFDLLSASLLVDGLPLSRLPKSYTSQPNYPVLFGSHLLDVMPASTHGMDFTAQEQWHGFTVSFGLRPMDDINTSKSDRLSVSAERDGQRYDFIPQSVFRDHLPLFFIKEFVHWYDHSSHTVVFTRRQAPWTLSAPAWKASRSLLSWSVGSDEGVLVDCKSRSASTIAKILQPLENAERIHLVFTGLSLPVTINLPRLRLVFLFWPGTSTLESKEFRKFSIDSRQTINTLAGLQNKLTLRHESSGKRMILIPNGDVSFCKTSHHVDISIEHSVTNVFHYRIDDDLGRLLGSGNLESMLFLAYLHALSSYCCPDPLTNLTGTEQATTILRSAAVRSFHKFDKRSIEILKLITEVAPTRNYYPLDKTEMQQVFWKTKLDFLTQDSLLIPPVQAIFSQITDSKIFHGNDFILPPSLRFGNDELLARDLHRSSMYRVSGFGTEYFKQEEDRIYPARDRLERSEADHRVYITACFIDRKSSEIFLKPSPQLRDHLWSIFDRNGPVQGNVSTLTPLDLSYDPKWLDKPLKLLVTEWYGVVASIRNMRQQGDIFQLLLWVTCLAFGKDVNMQTVQLLASYFLLEVVSDIALPAASSFTLAYGRGLQISELESMIESAAKPFRDSAEAKLLKELGESDDDHFWRRKLLFDHKLHSITQSFLSQLRNQWPCETPMPPQEQDLRLYINVDNVMVSIRNYFKQWHSNLKFYNYLTTVEQALKRHKIQSIPRQCQIFASTEHIQKLKKRFIHTSDLFERISKRDPPVAPTNPSRALELVQTRATPNLKLPALIAKLEKQSQTAAETEYVKDLIASMDSLRNVKNNILEAELDIGVWKNLLQNYLDECSSYVKDLYDFIIRRAIDVSPLLRLLNSISHGPRISPVILLQRILSQHWLYLGQAWKDIIIRYGLALTELHRARRLLRCEIGSAEFVTELLNVGHSNWLPSQFPESLLLEIDGGIMIRAKQEEIASYMRAPPKNRNATMQLNMGEGKSSVIIPHVASSLADGSALVRVIVGRPQSKQMLAMLSSKLCGILDHRIYHLPFSRDIILGLQDARKIQDICKECQEQRGVLLVQPEHLLSLKLMSIERVLAEDHEVAKSLLQTLRYLEKNSRDIVDECDEHFNVTFELVYTIGVQKPVDFSPYRWVVVLEMLDYFHHSVLQVQRTHPHMIEIENAQNGRYPRIRILDPGAHEIINLQIAQYICSHGISEFPIVQQQEQVRNAAFRYMTQASLTMEDGVAASMDQGGFWTESKRQVLFLIRGLLAGGVFAFAFGLKRWRVNYGLDATRIPATKLAIPFRAKDNPSPRSEFSHTEVILVLTTLSYLYGGMVDEDIFVSIEHLLQSDQAASKYQDWVRTAPDLPPAFRQLSGLNSKDRTQCIESVFPHLRYSKGLIDFYLSHVVFPKYMREFPSKLSASGWDIGKSKTMPLTGFSGTNDSRHVLPLEVDYLEIAEQKHTNALVLEHLLQDCNSVYLLPSLVHSGQSETIQFLNVVTNLKPQIRVILDVGAQLIDLNNLQVAQSWLKLLGSYQDIEAAVFVDDHHELTVVDRCDRCSALQSSPYADKLDSCIVYLDEIHTRGIDLVLPIKYRAAVTLGSGLTKDRLVQACMRMRKLHMGQSVMFCVPTEIAFKIRKSASLSPEATITMPDLLAWSISQTFEDSQRSMTLWASQGLRHGKHSQIWKSVRTDDTFDMIHDEAKEFLDDEAMSLERRYSPASQDRFEGLRHAASDPFTRSIYDRLAKFTQAVAISESLQGEQERELAPEIEEERHIELPPSANAELHNLHKDVQSFVKTGAFSNSGLGFLPAFDILDKTTAAHLYDSRSVPKGIMVTQDFARTIKSSPLAIHLDAYQRSVQWIVTSAKANGTTVTNMVIISSFEAYKLLPVIRQTRKVTLHMYSPRVNEEFGSLDHLSVYTEGRSFNNLRIPDDLVNQLNMFAGQLYFDSYAAYTNTCKYLGLRSEMSDENCLVDGDGFILDPTKSSSEFSKNPVPILKILVNKIRRHGQDIARTHVGKMLGGVILDESELETTPEDVSMEDAD